MAEDFAAALSFRLMNRRVLGACVALVLSSSLAAGQGGRGAQQQAPSDVTGWWVSVVTEDWRWRMVTPKKGDYASMPLTDEGRKAADAWDPAKDEREGNACKAYGGAAIMRMPTRLHITWQDDNTLKVEADAGTQTRIFRFGGSADLAGSGEPSWQGNSKATWKMLGNVAVARGGGGQGQNGGGGGAANAPQAPRFGSLKVVTDRLKPGYLRRNGVPYTGNAVVTELFDRQTEKNGDVWMTVTTIVEDPKYLTGQYITSSGFKREPDGAKWHPTPCSAQ
jgi:hypothetical protein